MISVKLRDIFTAQHIDLAFILALFFITVYLGWSLELAILLSVLLYFILKRYRSVYYLGVAIISGFISATMLALEYQSVSEKAGVISFISMIIFLVKQIMYIGNKEPSNDTDTDCVKE